jgi:hypothetical protein
MLAHGTDIDHETPSMFLTAFAELRLYVTSPTKQEIYLPFLGVKLEVTYMRIDPFAK